MKLELFKRMLRGETNPDETRQVMQWLEEDSSELTQAMASEYGQMSHKAMPEGTREQMLQFFEQHGINSTSKKLSPVIPIKRVMYRWIAAAIILLVAGAAWWLLRPVTKAIPAVTWKEVRNNSTKAMLVTLPDSSKIWLNTEAAIRYRTAFNSYEERTVSLIGEAYFSVAHDSLHPFIVQTENVFTRVLGTEFNVEAYAGEQMIKVSLQKGKVQMNYTDSIQGHISKNKILLPGQMAVYNKKNAVITVKQFPLAMPQGWINNELVLNDVPLQDALNRIAIKYHCRMVFNTGRAARYRHVTASYRDMDLSQVLSQLGFTCNFSVKYLHNAYHINIE